MQASPTGLSGKLRGVQPRQQAQTRSLPALERAVFTTGREDLCAASLVTLPGVLGRAELAVPGLRRVEALIGRPKANEAAKLMVAGVLGRCPAAVPGLRPNSIVPLSPNVSMIGFPSMRSKAGLLPFKMEMKLKGQPGHTFNRRKPTFKTRKSSYSGGIGSGLPSNDRSDRAVRDWM